MTNLKKLPKYESDEEAERFVEQSDLSEFDLSGFRKLSEVVQERRAGRPALGDKAKEHISLRLDRDVIAKFKETGKGWQGRINEVLRNSRPAGTAVYASRLSAPASTKATAAKAVAKPAPAKAAPSKKSASAGMKRSSKEAAAGRLTTKSASKKRKG